MKKTFLAFLTGLFLSSPIFSLTNGFTFEVEPLFGVRNAVLNEFVYNKNSKTGEEYYLSLLNWNLKNSFYTGLNADVSYKAFHINAGFKAFIPNDFGSMDDSDWQQDYVYHTGNSSLKTNYSEHDLNFSQGFNIDISARFNFSPCTGLTLAPLAGFSFETYSMVGKNGYGYYGYALSGYKSSYYGYDDIPNRYIHDFSGQKVIKLEREDYYTWIGIGIGYITPNHKLQFALDLNVSPWVYIISRDTHLQRNIYFIDLGGQAFSAFKANLFVQYNFNSIYAIKFTANGLFTTDIKGIEYISDSVNGPYKRSGTVIGSASRYLDFQISAILKF